MPHVSWLLKVPAAPLASYTYACRRTFRSNRRDMCAIRFRCSRSYQTCPGEDCMSARSAVRSIRDRTGLDRTRSADRRRRRRCGTPDRQRRLPLRGRWLSALSRANLRRRRPIPGWRLATWPSSSAAVRRWPAPRCRLQTIATDERPWTKRFNITRLVTQQDNCMALPRAYLALHSFESLRSRHCRRVARELSWIFRRV